MSPPIEGRPDVAKYVADWRKSNEGRVFEFSTPSGQEEFLAALAELGRHLAHTARQAKIYTITSKDGLSTIYLDVEN